MALDLVADWQDLARGRHQLLEMRYAVVRNTDAPHQATAYAAFQHTPCLFSNHRVLLTRKRELCGSWWGTVGERGGKREYARRGFSIHASRAS